MNRTKAMLLVDRLETRVKAAMEVLVWEDVNRAMEELQIVRLELETLRQYMKQEVSGSSDD